MEMDHFSHEHTLTLIECEGKIGEENTKIRCYGCKKFCTMGLIYACTKCCFYLHRSCAELPEEFQNPFHPHTLTLYLDSSTRRDATSAPFWECYCCCKDLDEGFFFQCKVCKFNLHVDCALYIPTKEDSHKQHVTHFHPLTLIECEGEIRCKGCEKFCTNCPIYACTKCCFYLHRSCSELPQKLQNPFHPHPLTLHLNSFSATFGRFLKCYYCYEDIEGFFFQCKVCKFKLDVDCALLIPTKEEGHKQLLHVTHLHPLTLVDDITDDITKEDCLVCGKHCLGPCYGCNPCGRVLLHQPCAEFQLPPEIHNYFTHQPFAKFQFPQEIHNFIHQPFANFQLPQEIKTYIHPCPLALQTQVKYFQCGGCSSLINGMAYFCEQCNFWTDVECALSTNILSQGQEQFKHYSHSHPLVLIDKMDDQIDWHCFACGTCSLAPTYVCNNCKFFLHQSCSWFPPKIQDPLHSPHPLTLLVRPATLFRGKSTQVKIPCNVCTNDSNGTGITYHCDLCDFNLHGKCTRSGIVPTVKYEDHGHLLCLVEKIDPEIKCNACSTCCDSWVLHCNECNFNLHLPCGPLPYTIKHKCHIDPLTLRESPVEEDDSDNEFYCDVCEELRNPRLPFYYCADCRLVAEIKCVISEVALWLNGDYGDVDFRTPAGRIIGKVISKSLVVKEMAKGEAEQEIKVHSKTKTRLEEGKVKSVFTLDHILHSFTGDENAELNDILKLNQNQGFSLFSFFFGNQDSRPEHSKTQPKSRRDYSETFLKNEEEVVSVRDNMMKTISAGKKLFDEQDNLDIPLLSDMVYKEFMQKLESWPEYAITFWKNDEVVSVGDYMVTRNLAPVLEGLCATYGDVSTVEYEKITSRVKMVLLVILCGTIDSICNTKVVDISEDLILNWWNNLKLLQSAGLKIKFAFDQLKRVVHAYLGLRLRKQEDKTLAQLKNDIKMYSEAIEEFTKIMEGLKLKCQQIEFEQFTRKSTLIEECLREGSKLKWRNAGEGLQLKKLD